MRNRPSSPNLFALAGPALLLAAFGLQAASVGVSGYTNDFSARPAAVDFATATIGGGSGDITTADGYTPLDIGILTGPVEPIGASRRRGPLVLSEIMYHPAARPDGRNLEFIELYNSQEWFEDIGGYRISGAVDYTFATNTLLPAHGYILLAAVPADIQAVYGISGALAYTGSLPNNSGTLRLRNRQDAILWETTYDSTGPWPVTTDGGGHSLVLARPSFGEVDPRAWAASDQVGGSPGTNETAAANPYRTIVINEFLARTDDPELDFIELFNYSTQAVNLGGCVLTDDAATNKFTIPAGTIIPAVGFVVYDQNQLGFALNSAGETIYFKNTNGTRIMDAVRFGGQAKSVSTGRHPDGAPGFQELETKTPAPATRGGCCVTLSSTNSCTARSAATARMNSWSCIIGAATR